MQIIVIPNKLTTSKIAS